MSELLALHETIIADLMRDPKSPRDFAAKEEIQKLRREKARLQKAVKKTPKPKRKVTKASPRKPKSYD